MSESVYPILLVEDNPDDVLITKMAWKKGQIKNELFVVNNGEEALKFLHKEEKYLDVKTPCLILLDLKMPRMDGFQVLKNVKDSNELKSIPVIVLTSSDRINDVEQAYKLGCNSYIVKPVDFNKFMDSLMQIKLYWLTLSKIPTPIRVHEAV